MRLLPVFIILPLVEIALFVVIGGELGLWPTLGLVLLSAVLGISLLRNGRLLMAQGLQRQAAAGQNPLASMGHVMLSMMAAVLLILPGFFTSTIGLLLLIRPLRDLLIAKMGSKLNVAGFGMNMGGFNMGAQDAWGQQQPRRDQDITVIDAEYFEVEENPTTQRPSGWTRH